jgi:2-polyprenyl-3-methyl-5-hydroxy-6-metoxy-1,4-benzoquinol methylase
MTDHLTATPTAPDTSHRAQIYERYVTTTYAARTDISDEGLQKSAQEFATFFGPYLPADRNEAILEIGVGKGGFLLCCQKKGYTNVTGIDISPEQVEYCHQHGFTNVVCANAVPYLLENNNYYGLIVLSDVLEHLTKDEAMTVLRAIRERLKPGGRVILRVPNMSNPFNIRTRYVDFTHEIGLSKESLQQILRVNNFQIETVKGAFNPHPNPLVRLVFDQLLWRAFLLFYRHTMHLGHDVERGKNLIAVARRPTDQRSESR